MQLGGPDPQRIPDPNKKILWKPLNHTEKPKKASTITGNPKQITRKASEDYGTRHSSARAARWGRLLRVTAQSPLPRVPDRLQRAEQPACFEGDVKQQLFLKVHMRITTTGPNCMPADSRGSSHHCCALAEGHDTP